MMKELGVWPAFVKLSEDELLSSWITRLAQAHHLKTHTFTKLVWPSVQFWNRDIDRVRIQDVMEVLARCTNTPLIHVECALLNSFEYILMLNYTYKTSVKWIMPLGIYHRKRSLHGLSYCPSCLRRMRDIPYFKKQWRLSLTVVCTDCNCLLYDECPNCQSEICFFRNDIGHKNHVSKDPLSICYNCKFDLSISDIIKPSESAYSLQSLINSTIKKGYNPFSGYSFLFFEGLYMIFKIFISRRKYIRNEGFKIEVSNKNPSVTYDRLRISERLKIFEAVQPLLEDWPNQFLEFTKSKNLNGTMLTFDMKDIPFWYLDKLRWYSNL